VKKKKVMVAPRDFLEYLERKKKIIECLMVLKLLLGA